MARACSAKGCRLSRGHVGSCPPPINGPRQRLEVPVHPVFGPGVAVPDQEFDFGALKELRALGRWAVAEEVASGSGCDVRALSRHILPRLRAKGLVEQDRRYWRAV